MTPLEKALLDKLLLTYEARGIHPQEILNNPLFLELPLSSKIKALDSYADRLSKPAVFSPKEVLGATLLGSLGLAGLVTAQTRLAGGINPAKVVAGAGLGAILGASVNAIKQLKSVSEDNKIAQNILERSSLSALVNKSLMRPITGPEDAGREVAKFIAQDLALSPN